jgi:hypothetical protein
MGAPDLSGRKLFSEVFSECLQLVLRERINRAEWWIRALDQLYPMVIFRVVRETIYLLFMPLDIGTGGLASRLRFFGTGGLACWSGIGFSRTGDLADRFGLGIGLSFPNFSFLG